MLTTDDPVHPDGQRLAHIYQDGVPIKLLLEHDDNRRFPSAKRHPHVYDSILQVINSNAARLRLVYNCIC